MNSNEIGTVNPRMDVKVGDRVQVNIGEGRMVAGKIVETIVTNTFVVEDVHDFSLARWCRGTIVESTSATPENYIGRQGMAHLGRL